MHLRNYERPEGWVKGHPEVLVTNRVIEELGVPAVDYDSLHQFLTDDLQIPYGEKTDIKLYGRSPNSPLGGFHVPFTRTVHINPIVAENRFSATGGTMRLLAHEARHRSDSTNKKGLVAVEVLARWASYKAGYELVEALPYVSPFALYGGYKARSIYYKHEPAEKRARLQEKHPSTREHEKDILFPLAPRTDYLVYNRELNLETIKKLGLSASYEHFASDNPDLNKDSLQ